MADKDELAEAAHDAEYEYVADGSAQEAGEAQALGPATEEQAAELRGADLPDIGARMLRTAQMVAAAVLRHACGVRVITGFGDLLRSSCSTCQG